MTLVTAEALFWMPSENNIVELVDGERSWQNGHRRNWLHPSPQPDTVRAPDFAFVRKDRWTDTNAYIPGAPDLAIEVISFNDIYAEVDARVIDWLRSGTQLVIVIDPARQSAEIHRSLSKFDRVDSNGSLDGGTVVPGWTLPLRDLFVP